MAEQAHSPSLLYVHLPYPLEAEGSLKDDFLREEVSIQLLMNPFLVSDKSFIFFIEFTLIVVWKRFASEFRKTQASTSFL